VHLSYLLGSEMREAVVPYTGHRLRRTHLHPRDPESVMRRHVLSDRIEAGETPECTIGSRLPAESRWCARREDLAARRQKRSAIGTAFDRRIEAVRESSRRLGVTTKLRSRSYEVDDGFDVRVSNDGALRVSEELIDEPAMRSKLVLNDAEK